MSFYFEKLLSLAATETQIVKNNFKLKVRFGSDSTKSHSTMNVKKSDAVHFCLITSNRRVFNVFEVILCSSCSEICYVTYVSSLLFFRYIQYIHELCWLALYWLIEWCSLFLNLLQLANVFSIEGFSTKDPFQILRHSIVDKAAGGGGGGGGDKALNNSAILFIAFDCVTNSS